MATATSTKTPKPVELAEITEIAARLELEPHELEPHGRHKGKVDLSALARLRARRDGKLVAVTAITPDEGR